MRRSLDGRVWAVAAALAVISCSGAAPRAATDAEFDVVLRGGRVYDGGGDAPYDADVAITGDRIAAIGDLGLGRGRLELDVSGLAVAPGFINMLSWADETLLADPRSLSDIHQGVTLEVFGEGTSMGPLNETMRQRLLDGQGDVRYEVPWTTLGEYLQHLERRGVATNVASFVGATTVRIHELGYENRAPTAEQLERMRELVRQAMREGALGVGSSLPYVPAAFAATDELAALARAAAEHGGMYISHIRGEGDTLLESLEEFFEIVRRAGGRGEIYHLKASGKANWTKFAEAVRRIEGARAAGLAVTADVYPYAASSTGLTVMLPEWVQEGGSEAMRARLRDPELRARAVAELDMIPPEDILLSSFRSAELRPLTGKTLGEVAALRGTSPEETVIDLLLEDRSRVGTVRFTMSEDNVRAAVALPWVSFCSDASSIAPEPPYTNAQPHPRAYGAFARVLGKYVRDERVLELREAVRRLSGFPAGNLRLQDRGLLRTGYYADVVVFDPATIRDHATFTQPHQLATGVVHVLVNGQPVLRDGRHTGATPGRFVKGPGWSGAAVTGAESASAPRVTDGIALLDIWIREQMTYRDVPGLAIGVVYRGDLVWAKGYGWSDREARTPVSAATEFRLGSLTKLFTATAILQLRDQGKLGLDDPVTKHLSWFIPANPFPEAPPITLRHLLTHTSGLPREAAFPYWTTHQFPSREQVRVALPGQTLVFPAGETYKYSNLGMSVLGEVVTAVSGESYAEYLRRRIAAPLGMKATTAAPAAEQIARLARQYRRRLPDGSRGTFDYYDTGGIAPAAAVVSNLEDLARFAAFQLGYGPDAGERVLRPATLAEMHRAQFVYPSWTGGRGLGFAVSRHGDTTFVSHPGWIGGHRAELLLEPEAEIAVIAFTNADDASPGLFARKAFDLVGRAIAGASTPAVPAAPTGAAPDPAWQTYLGIYTDPWDWEYQVLILDGGLVLYEHGYPPEDDPEGAVTRLTPAGPHTFRMPDGEPVVFELGADGRVQRLRRRYEILLPKKNP